MVQKCRDNLYQKKEPWELELKKSIKNSGGSKSEEKQKKSLLSLVEGNFEIIN